MLKYFRDQSKGLLGVIASEVIDLPKYLLIVQRQQLVEEDRCIVSIGLTEMGCMWEFILSV
jgi:hypothetical protein